ncbi:hypothetical protein CMUS01_14134 [Colletotrichum musicola]|uniref:Zn(2)-C6 fungal-type domain-containing protein n=1 Tax=Colletotrichum musicola TaxID=2175873 RepID=A0A8H6J7G2_9PEZI|nr:hypothetical protein CMUS01_14134 [Colletotrichum musicola]
MPQPTKPETKRRHVTTACISCRESKIKCDGATPSCSNCRNKRRDCRYQAGEDKRKLSLRVAVELLSGRVDQLCQFIAQNGLQPPPMPPDEDKSLTRILDTLGLTKVVQVTLSGQSSLTPPIDPALSMSGSNSTRRVAPANPVNTCSPLTMPPAQLPLDFASPFDPAALGFEGCRNSHVPPSMWEQHHRDSMPRGPNDWDWNTPGNSDVIHTPCVDVGSVRAPSHPLLSSYSEEAALSDADNEDDDASGTTEEDLVNQLSDRLGSLHIGPNGKISYYGPTSNFSLVEMPAGSDRLAVDRTVRDNGQDHLNNLGYGKTIPADLEEQLINLYFSWQDPFSHIVDRTLYEQAKFRWFEREEDTPYYSEALRNAMCALGAAFEARYHPSFVTFPKSLPDFFAARAKTLLEIELDSPSVSTVQAMVVLSSHEIGANRDSRGWLYSGMALRLAFDLALHKDMAPYVAKGVLTPAEAELRRAVFWGTYAVDQTLGYYRGRPFRISMDDITVQKPGSGGGAETNGRWLPCASPQSGCSPPVPQTDHVESVSVQRIELCEIMAPLGHTLYGNSKIPRNVLQEGSEKTVARLFLWKERLPGILQVDPDDTEGTYLPHVLLLHMQYYQNVIHAHRPWMSSSYLQPQPPQGPGYVHAQRMCIESATAVAKLIQIYERLYSLRRVNTQGVAITFSAAIILIFASVSRRRRRRTAETATHLGVCFRALEEFSLAWECAKRARDFLLMLQRKWELRSRRMAQQQQQGSAHAQQYQHQQPGMPSHLGLLRSGKRARTDSPAGSGSKSISSFQSISPGQPGEQPPATADERREEHERIDMDMRLDLDWVLAAGAQSMPANWDNLLPPEVMYFDHPPAD